MKRAAPPTLSDIFDYEELSSIVRDFSDKFGFCAFILDSYGRVVVEKPMIPDYCRQILTDKDKACRCFDDTRKRLKIRKSSVKPCWAGFSKIVVPIRFLGTIIGFWITCGIPDSADKKFIKALSDLIDNFISNFLKTYEKWWEEREQLMKVLNGLISVQDYDKLIEEIVKVATKILKTDRTTLYIHSGGGLTSKIAEGLDREINISLGEGIAGMCALKRQVITVEEVNQESDVKLLIKDYKIRNLICAPIIFKKHLLGVIESFNKEKAFTAKDSKLISYLADAAAIALNNASTLKELESLAIIDPLTQLYNRAYFVKNLDKELSRLSRYQGSLAIMFIDADDFKKLNDTYGHTIGDLVLKDLAGVLKKTLRDVDIAARFGGEEFVIMLPNTDRDGAMSSAKRLQETLQETPLTGHIISVSIGVAIYKKGLTAKVLIDRADKAMYRVKKTQKGQISLWD